MAEELLLNERSDGLYRTTLKTEAGVPVTLASLTSLTLTLTDRATGSVINGRSGQDVKNANGGTFGVSDGTFTMIFGVLDTVLVTASADEEHHLAVFEAAWTGGGTRWAVDLWVKALALAPPAATVLQANALLTMSEARQALKQQLGAENTWLASLINAVSDRWESETGRALKTRTYTGLRLGANGESVLKISGRWPITTLTSVTVSGTTQTVWTPGAVTDPDDADVVLLDTPDRNELFRSAGWGVGLYHIVATFTAGYGVAGFPIPGDLREAVAATLRHFHYLKDRQQAAVATRASGAETITYLNTAMPAEVWPVIRAYRDW